MSDNVFLDSDGSTDRLIDDQKEQCDSRTKKVCKPSIMDALIDYSRQLGVNDAVIIDSSQISAEENLAEICKKEKCPGYGSAPSCPPYAMNPEKFRNLTSTHQSALIFKFDVPTHVFFGEERPEVLHLLHETASALKVFAINSGCKDAIAIAAGSCKQVFCQKFDDCPVLTGSGRCRHSGTACQSMSGMGINFNKIIRLLGWDDRTEQGDQEPTSNMAAIVLLKL